MASRFIHITNGNISFLFFWQGQNNFPLCVCVCLYVYHIFCIYPWWTLRLLWCLGLLLICRSECWGAYFVGIVFSFYSYIYPVVELLDHMVVLFLIVLFLRKLDTISTVTASIDTPTNSAYSFPFLYKLINICCLFDNSHSNRCEVLIISHYGFDLNIPNYQWCWAPFQVHIGHLCVFYGKTSI